MKITTIQPDLIWEDKKRNLEKLEMLISSVSGSNDIFVLPEMFNSGFSMNTNKIAETPGSLTFEWMQNISKKTDSGICGSIIIKENKHFYNRWIFVTPENESWVYDKRHLFSPGNEDKIFSRGNKRLVFSFRGFRICANICYDLRFPVWSRNLNDYDILINSANWPESRREVWSTLLKARAIENQCYIVGVNRIGNDGNGIKYHGDSMIIGPKGNVIAGAGENKECFTTGEISLPELNDFRKTFPVLKDADLFTITS